MPEPSSRRFPSWIVFLGAALSTVTATAIATTAAVAVAEHDHVSSLAAIPEPAACDRATPMDVALTEAVRADSELFGAPALTEVQVLAAASRYEWFVRVHDEMAGKGPVAWARARQASLEELAHDVAEMKRLEQHVRELEAEHQAREAAAQD